MTAVVQPISSATSIAVPRAHSIAGIARIYFLEGKYELFKLLRLPAFLITSLGFPLMFYTLFGLLLPIGKSGFNMSVYLVATYGAFDVIGIALFALGVGVATERGQGWLAVKRASPMPLPAGSGVWILTGIVAALFLPLYFRGYWARGRESYFIIAAITALGVVLVPFNSSGVVLFIYAAAFAGMRRPTRRAVMMLAAMTLLVVAEAAIFALPFGAWI